MCYQWHTTRAYYFCRKSQQALCGFPREHNTLAENHIRTCGYQWLTTRAQYFCRKYSMVCVVYQENMLPQPEVILGPVCYQWYTTRAQYLSQKALQGLCDICVLPGKLHTRLSRYSMFCVLSVAYHVNIVLNQKTQHILCYLQLTAREQYQSQKTQSCVLYSLPEHST